MSKTLVLAFACAALGSSLALFGAQAFPISSVDAQLGTSDVTLVAGGCGIGFHRGLMEAAGRMGPSSLRLRPPW